MARKKERRPGQRLGVLRQAAGQRRRRPPWRRSATCSTPRKQVMPGRSIPWPPAFCRSRLGEATKTVPYLVEADKVYVFTITFGTSTDSVDAEGRVIGQSDARPDARGAGSSHSRPISAPSSRCRRPFRRSRSTASVPMSWRVSRHRGRTEGAACQCFRSDARCLRYGDDGDPDTYSAARAPMFARWRATCAPISTSAVT